MMHDGEIWRRIRTGALRPAERRNGTEGISIHHGDLALSRGLRLTLTRPCQISRLLHLTPSSLQDCN